MKCPKCHTENPEGKKFCRGCGAQLISICPQCGSEINPEDNFCSDCGHKLEVAETSPGASWPAIEVGRKHATVLFSDLLGYTAISEKLDPEDVRDLMGHIFGEISQVLAKYEGYIDRFIGDAVLAIFGIPKTHEDDAVRAIRAAREIHDLVSHLSRRIEAKIGLPLVMHTGIDTGIIVADESGNFEGGYSITGDTINLASRLSDLAEADEILVSPDSYRLAEGYFTFHDLGPTDIKGKAKPVRVYKLLSVKEKPVTIHRLSGLKADLIGRNIEIGRLWEALGRLREGRNVIISIYGDAGTGKSRLVEEFKATAELEEVQWIEGHAYAYCQNTPYFPFIDAMNRVWQIKEGDSSENIREKLESGIERTIDNGKDIIPYIGSLYSLSYPELKGIDPELWKKRLYNAIMEILSTAAQRNPTVFFIEDIHWADPSSLELIRYISTELRHPAIFLYAYRPYFNLFTSQQVNILDDLYQEIEVLDLPPSEAKEMMSSLLKTKAIPYELSQFVQEKAEGNPFYLEEVVNTLIESETLIRDDGDWKLTRDLSEYGLSLTIHGVISARVDCLEGEMKRTLQEASVIGRAFLYRILKAVTEFKENVDKGLNELERLDLIRMKSALPDVEYIFKHALTQDIVYHSLLKKEREEIHQRIGYAIEKLFPDRLLEFYESLAYHFQQSPSTFKAFHYLEKSGEKSLDRYALEESHQYFEQAYDILSRKRGRTKEEDTILVDLLIKWAFVYYCRGNEREMTDLLSANQELAESLGDKAKLGMFYVWLGTGLLFKEKIKDAYQYQKKALKLGEEIEDQKVISYACAQLSWICMDFGLLDEAIAYGERAKEISRSLEPDHYLYDRFMTGMGMANFCKGEVKKLLAIGEALVEYGQSHSSSRCLGAGQVAMGVSYFLDGDFPTAIEYAKKGVEVSVDPSYTHAIGMFLGMFYVGNDQFQEAKEVLQQCITHSEKFGYEFWGTPAKMCLGIVSISEGRMGQGLKTIEQIQRLFMEKGRKVFYAQSEYILGNIYLQMVEKAVPMKLATVVKNMGFLIKNVPFAARKAENHFNKAIEVAREIGANGVMGQSYLGLGFLHRAKGKKTRAKECLSTAIELCEKYEMETSLRQAREALASLE